MDKILRIASPQAIGVSDGLYSFVVRLNEAPTEHWIYSFKLATPVAREFDRRGGIEIPASRPGEPESERPPQPGSSVSNSHCTYPRREPGIGTCRFFWGHR